MSTSPPSNSTNVGSGTGAWVGVVDGRRGRGRVRGVERVAREHVLDVHEQQLLVLLLVMTTHLDDAVDALEHVVASRREHRFDRGVDMTAVVADLVDARSRDQSPLGSRVTAADLLVVRVEEVRVRRVGRLRSPRARGSRTNVSKNQVVWARCHFVGLTSGIDWTTWSSADSGAASASVERAHAAVRRRGCSVARAR